MPSAIEYGLTPNLDIDPMMSDADRKLAAAQAQVNQQMAANGVPNSSQRAAAANQVPQLHPDQIARLKQLGITSHEHLKQVIQTVIGMPGTAAPPVPAAPALAQPVQSPAAPQGPAKVNGGGAAGELAALINSYAKLQQGR